MKKSKRISFVLLIVIILTLVMFGIILLNYFTSDRNIIKGYYKSKVFGDKYGFQHYTEYYKYYYVLHK